MAAWITSRYREHPWLTIAVAVYLVVSASELTRILLFDRPTTHDAGFHAWEDTATPPGLGATMRFHWSRAEGNMLRPVDGAVLSMMLYEAHPEMPAGGVPITLTLGDHLIDEFTILENGWHSRRYYLPPILGAELWARVETGWAQRTRAEAAIAGGSWFAGWQELKPWHRRPGPPSMEIDITAGATFVPSELLESDDERTLGVGVADPQWRAELPPDGIGFHPWESDAGDMEFRWTRRWASLPLQPQGPEAIFSIRAHHPDIEKQPVVVDFFWDADLRLTVSLSRPEWVEVRLPLGTTNRTGVLTTRVDRTWNPSAVAAAPDNRDLGVGITRIEWR